MTNKNTFPPLISGASVDLLGNKQLYGSLIRDSLVVHASDNDPFFHPTLGLTGYSWEGKKYSNGVLISGTASWANEIPGMFRGYDSSFPTNALILLTDLCLGIYDIDNDLSTWMIILRKDRGAFTHSLSDSSSWVGYEDSGFVPVGLEYTSGRVLIHMVSDRGSTLKGGMLVGLNFSSDSVKHTLSEYDEGLSVEPHVTTGYLQSEPSWVLRRLDVPSVGSLNAVYATNGTAAGTTGDWAIKGYTPSVTPDPNFQVKVALYIDDVETELYPCLTKGDGTWDSTTWSDTHGGVTASRKKWEFRIIRLADDTALFKSGQGHGGLLTIDLAATEELLPLTNGSVQTQHQALALMAMTASTGISNSLQSMARYLVRIQNSDGSWPWMVNRETCTNLHPTYKSCKLTAMCVYALLYFIARSASSASVGMRTDIRTAAQNGLAFLRTKLHVTGPVTDGHGYLEHDGGYLDLDRLEVGVEASLWSYFAFDLAFTLPLAGTGYNTTRDSIAAGLFIPDFPSSSLELALSAIYLKKRNYSEHAESVLQENTALLCLPDGTYRGCISGGRDIMGSHFLSLAMMRVFGASNAWKLLEQDLMPFRGNNSGWGWSPLVEDNTTWEEESVGATAAAILANHSTHHTYFLA